MRSTTLAVLLAAFVLAGCNGGRATDVGLDTALDVENRASVPVALSPDVIVPPCSERLLDYAELKAVSEAQAEGWRPPAGPIFVEISAQKAADVARAGSIAVVVTESGSQFEFGDFFHSDLPECETP